MTVGEMAFLSWAAPRLGLRADGFRRVRRQVLRRVRTRLHELGLPDLDGYQRWLDGHHDEWARLDALCRVTISRFARDRPVWDALVADVLPRLAREANDAGRAVVRAWSAGCGAGEEPYTLAIAWTLALPDAPALEVLATDTHEGQLARAVEATYPRGTLRELPAPWQALAFDDAGDQRRVRARFRAPVRFARHDLRTPPPPGPFELILCRNLAFTYFAEPVQREVAARLRGVLRPGGVLVVGKGERLPDGVAGLSAAGPGLYAATAS